jgi:HD-like signal output (HDOD) protein
MKIVDTNIILFVDSDANQLASLKRNLRDYRDQWIMYFVADAAAAMEVMSQLEVDVIVCETQLTAASGTLLLKQVQERYPRTTRLLFSGQALRAPAQEMLNYAHQFIAKPCSKEELIAVLERVTQLRESINNPAMEALVNSLANLPSLPQTYQELMTALQDDATTVKKIGQIVAKDIGMSTKILQMVNSAFFGLPNKVASPDHAVSLLGTETITNLALSAGIFTQLDEKLVKEFDLETLWQHSLAVASLAKRLAVAYGMPPQESELPMLAGMLHDLGQVVLTTCDTSEYRRIIQQAKEQNEPIHLVESESLWCSHAALGAYLMGLWGLPFTAVEAVALHHTSEKQTLENPACLIVYAADLLLYSSGPFAAKPYSDLAHLESLLGSETFNQWSTIAQELIDG